MKIDIWSDFACPFCYIGKRRLEEALADFVYRDQVEIVYHSYELAPNASVQQEKTIHEVIAEKYGISVNEAKRMNGSIEEQAQSAGLSFDFDHMILTNTFDAHRLTHFARIHGKDYEMTEKLFHAYFSDGKNLSDYATLADLAAEVGLNREEALEVLEKNAFSDRVRADEEIARKVGIKSVPLFVLDQKYTIAGAQPKETFLRAFEKVWNEAAVNPALQDLTDPDHDVSCGDGDCTIPEDE